MEKEEDSQAKLGLKKPQYTVVLAVLILHTIFLPCQMLIPKTLQKKCREAKALSPAGRATSDKHCPVLLTWKNTAFQELSHFQILPTILVKRQY